jgi:hypothetical protein
MIAEMENTRLSDDLSVYGSWTEYNAVQIRRSRFMMYSLMMTMGEDKFNELVKNFYGGNIHGITNSADFIRRANDIHGECLNGFFDGWIHGDTLPPLVLRTHNE